MKNICLIITGLLVISCPAGAATIASITPPTAIETTAIVPPMRATDLFIVPEIADIYRPERFIQTSLSDNKRIDNANGDIKAGKELSVGCVSNVISEFESDRQICTYLNTNDKIVTGAIIALN